jgi:transposase, IS30 family
MSKKYKQLSIMEREYIQTGLWEGKSIRTIAKELDRSPSTLSREIQRNGGQKIRKYSPRMAQERATKRIVTRGKRPRLKNEFIRTYVYQKLRKGWSPEQIGGRLVIDYPEHHISHEAIYQYIYTQYQRNGWGKCIGKDIRQYLRRGHKVRRPKKVPYAVERGALHNRISIDERPAVVDRRIQAGHWEGDSIVSKQSKVRLNTLNERVSGLVRISKLKNGKSKHTTKAVIRRLQRLPRRLRRTLTVDNGFEFAGHQVIAANTKTRVYFAHPYHSWERGSNENTNGLIRQYFPKKTDFATIPVSYINKVEYALNTRPRKRLDYKTPLEVFNCLLLH